MSVVRRREFITLFGGAAAWPLAANAQQPSTSPPKRPIIGFLAGGSKVANERYYSGFPEGMRGFGYLEGRDYAFEGRYAEGDLTRLPLLAEELIRLKPDVLLAGPTVAVVAANQVTASVPIVGINITDPVGRGLAASHARPGGNVTGILTRIEGLPGKQLEIAHDLLPAISKIGALVNPIDPSTGVQQRETDAAAAKFGVSLVRAEARAPGELGAAFELLARERVDIVVVFGDVMFLAARRQIAALALAARLPTIYNFREHVEDGGLICHGINLKENYRRGAYFVDRILKGEKPANLPIEFPTKVELIINLATAKALGLEIPPTLLARADEVIE
jgi:ABC-type uncharacterized transport system substrate-binding protein